MGRKPRLTDTEIINALKKTGGNMLATARLTGYPYSSLRVRIKQSSVLHAELLEAKAAALKAQAEALTSGDTP